VHASPADRGIDDDPAPRATTPPGEPDGAVSMRVERTRG
jgi:hypothetical protein